MVQFYIQPDSDIPASTQLFDQLSFAIASRQYPPGQQLPSTRQLASWTGLHRNTINKVYQQLKLLGLVEARGGSGIYVNQPRSDDGGADVPVQTVREDIDKLLGMGCTLSQIKETFLQEINWRLHCSAQVLVAYGSEDPGLGTIIAQELQQELPLPVQTITIEDMPQVLEFAAAGTIVTNRYFLEVTHKAIENHDIRVFPLEIYDYKREIARVHQLPQGSYVGLVSASAGILRVAESLIHSFRGDDLVVVTVMPQDTYRLQNLARSAHIAVTLHSGQVELAEAIAATRSDRIRPLEVLHCDRYIARESIEHLKLELGLQ